jgi:hypothetical protein
VGYILVALFVVSAGCNGLASNSNGTQETPITPENIISTDGADLRHIEVPDNGTITADGEIDDDDPILASSGAHYEPVQFTAPAGTIINATMVSDTGTPDLRLLGPNGTTITTGSASGGRDKFEMVELNQAGQYTFLATATNESSGFNYTLTVDQYIEPNFNGPPSSWDEESRYLEFGYDYLFTAENTSGQNLTAINRTANTDDDYIVATYEIEQNSTTYERLSIDSALQISYWYLYQAYTEDNPNIHNKSWVPERIYHRAITPDGDFYRSTYVTLEWAKDYGETGDPRLYAARYFDTLRYGPAHQEYVEGGNRSTTVSTFPDETYRNVSVNLTGS